MYKLRTLNGPNFKRPLLMFSERDVREDDGADGKIYTGKPIKVKSRKELIAGLKQHYWQYLREDNGDLPGATRRPPARSK